MARRTLHAGSNRVEGLGLKLFTEDELYDIHLATLDLLWNTGVRVESAQALDVFDGGGCTVNKNTKIVKIPAHIVEDAIHSTPSSFRACARDPHNDYIAGGNRFGFLNFGEAVKMVDPYTREIREASKKDVYDITRFCNAMDQVVCFERAISAREVDPEVKDVHNVEAFLQCSTKHAFIGLGSVDNIRAAFKMGAAVAGGEEAFRERPLFSTTTDPISPLTHTGEACDVLIEACRLGVPSKVNPISLPGATSCINLASTMVNVNAEILSMFVLGQLVHKGHPLIYGSSTGIMDLKTALASFGNPEMALFSGATAKMAQFYKFPSWVAGG